MKPFSRFRSNEENRPLDEGKGKDDESGSKDRLKACRDTFYRLNTPQTSLDKLVKSHSEPHEQKREVAINRVFEERFLSKIHEVTGFNPCEPGNLTRPYFRQVDGPNEPLQGLSHELESALDNTTIEAVQRHKGLFKLNPEVLEEVNGYLEKKPEDFSNLSQTFPEEITGKQEIKKFFETPGKSHEFFNSREAIELFKRLSTSIGFLFDSRLNLMKQEEYTLADHTAAVLDRFEKCFAQIWGKKERHDIKDVNSVLTVKDMRKLIVLHDFAKTAVFGETSLDISLQQKRGIIPAITEILAKMESEHTAKCILSVLKIDIGELHKNIAGNFGEAGKSSEQVAGGLARQIVKDAEDLNVNPHALARIAEAYFKCDAGSYPSMMERFSVKRDPGSESWKLEFNKAMQKGHDMLFEALDVLMRKQQAMAEAEAIQPTTKELNKKARMKRTLGFPDRPRTPERVNGQIAQLKETVREIGRQIERYYGSFPLDLQPKFSETLSTRVKQFRNSRDGAIDHYGEEGSGRYRQQRHTAEASLKNTNSILENMKTDLGTWNQFMVALNQSEMDQQTRKDALDTAKAFYATVLDGYQNEQVEPTERARFITQTKENFIVE